jgi:hypothetical protein
MKRTKQEIYTEVFYTTRYMECIKNAMESSRKTLSHLWEDIHSLMKEMDDLDEEEYE